jgi:formate dehydrogenase subunit delta
MNVDRLVKMANDIGAFFAAEPDKAKSTKGIADHIRSFWEPRMRRQICAHLDTGGQGLDPLVRKALTENRSQLGF